jgi:ribosome-associated toxin RatA of RatAB toxin-antitoxin module
MTRLKNQITIKAPLTKIWSILADLEALGKYDPTISACTALTGVKSGIGARRKVLMKDGKNWFEEKVTEWQPNESLTYTLTDCSFPITGLAHRYTFLESNNATTVIQAMEYTVKFGLLGSLLDVLMIKRQTSEGIQKFLQGLKHFAEENS